MTKFIADLCGNHNQDINRAKGLIKVSKEIGCWAVKMQYYISEKLWSKPKTIKAMKKMELDPLWIPELSEYAHSLGLKFGITPFFLDAVNEVEPYVDFYKIGSYEAEWHELIFCCCEMKKPIIVASGLMAVEDRLNLIKKFGYADLTILYCDSNYPADYNDAHLYRLQWDTEDNEDKHEKISYGWSDHTRQPGVIYCAINCGAEIVEFHLDKDGHGYEFEHGHCWLPEQIKNVIDTVDIMDKAYGMNLTDKKYSWKRYKLAKLMTDPKTGRRPY